MKKRLILLLGLALLFLGGFKSVAYCSDKLVLERNIVISAVFPEPPGEENTLMPNGEWVEVANLGSEPVSLAGWVLYDSDDSHELFITSENIFPKSDPPLIRPGEKLTVFRSGDSDFSLNKEKDLVRLFSGPLEMEGEIVAQLAYEEASEGEIVTAESVNYLEISEQSSKGEKIGKEEEKKGNGLSEENALEQSSEIKQAEEKRNKKSSTEDGKQEIDKKRRAQPLFRIGLEKEGESMRKKAEEAVAAKTFIAGTGETVSGRSLGSLDDLFTGFSVKIFLLSWAILTVAIVMTRKILKA